MERIGVDFWYTDDTKSENREDWKELKFGDYPLIVFRADREISPSQWISSFDGGRSWFICEHEELEGDDGA